MKVTTTKIGENEFFARIKGNLSVSGFGHTRSAARADALRQHRELIADAVEQNREERGAQKAVYGTFSR